ncbi:uncharacterized protein TRIREDRAFT_110023 [Trichoderma reesei QM6a]|jgi:hypothetical protein|uniref:Predicted protein n=1 Tax=Hypocrea jecorina (strain QM6a) TaxID=431241 RepID=G0RR10_HYPJQ|nr:uncharacterized protein TRIREDRAFT_110023 [Trichoderma reesei QM6a]EGR46355.1 predicted protein [Trichoderma reesei QM6a]
MTSSNEAPGDSSAPPNPTTPTNLSEHSKSGGSKDGSATDGKKTPGESPKSAPAAAPGGRPRSNTKKTEPPSLLHDFLLGRPSPARLQAERKRRQSMDTVKAEARHEMRQNQVRKLQPPSGVRDRVKTWQKANAAAMVDSNPDDAATEPTDVAFAGEEMESVTEEDRVRIKMRQKRRPPKAIVHNNGGAKSETDKKDKEIPPPPKKRIVSDDNWVKPKVRKPSVRKVSPRPRKTSNPTPARIPNGFVFRAVPNPSFQSKVKAWAEKVVTPPPKSLKGSLSSDLSDSEEEEEEDSDDGETATEVTARKPLKPSMDDTDGIRVRPIRKKEPDDDGIRVAPKKATDDDSIRVTPKKATNDDGIRVTPKKTTNDDGIRVAPIKASDDGIRVAPKKAADDGIRVTPAKPPPTAPQDDGIRVKPVEVKESKDGIRITRMKVSPPPRGDGIRVKPVTEARSESGTPRPTRQRSKSTGTASKKHTIHDLIKAVEEATLLSMSDGAEDLDSYLDAPAEEPRPKPRQGGVKRSGTKRPNTRAKSADVGSRAKQPPHIPDSDLGTTLTDRSLADIPGEIPFGHSAFSELDLPLRGPPKSRPKQQQQQQKRTKLDRATSLKAMPNVLKKVVEEGKKIIQEINEPSRHATPNNPPSIEKWLNNTVEPYEKGNRPPSLSSTLSDEDDEDDDVTIGEAAPRDTTREARREIRPKETTREIKPKEAMRETKARESRETTPKKTTSRENVSRESPHRASTSKETKHRRKPSAETRSSMVSDSRVVSNVTSDLSSNLTSSVETTHSEETTQSANASSPKSGSRTSRESEKRKSASSSSLKRRSATRDSLPSSKSGSTRRPFLGALKEAFQGESATLTKPIKAYQSQEERRFASDDDSLEDDDQTELEADSQYMQSNSELSSWVTTDTRSSTDRDSSVRSSSRGVPHIAGPRLRPPTNGHELSTILSEGSSVSHSETESDVSRSTLTRSTTVSKSTDPRTPQRQGSGLKRRLTKHSDLVSVLSLPDDANVPQRIKSNRSRPSLRKARGLSNNVTADDLLKEFAEDENLFRRELKTLVDGVIPVLLSHVVSDSTPPSELFGAASAKAKVDVTSKSVVNMGVVLEKLRNAHDKAPLNDIRRMANWAHGVVPIYNNYLGVWRLGFQDLIVNLAPRRGSADEDDSLLNALPRNANGDLINAQGERVAVAYLLKRPLLRIKQLARLIVCVDQMYPSPDTNQLVKDFEALQEKARQRHREEVARIIDEEAINTDTSRARDLRTLSPMKSVTIAVSRQVSAKDIFSLDLSHSNGQRLECQVELVHRDNQSRPEDKGDLLIREVGDGRRSYLLFPPISMSLVSARAGDGKQDMVVMVRGNHNGKAWHELLNLWADEEEQILDWLDILPSSPVPPRQPEPSILDESELGSDSPGRLPDVPVGVQSMVSVATRSDTTDHDDSDSGLATPPTPTRAAPGPPGKTEPSASRQIPIIYHNDAPPPRPPVHRTLSPTPQQSPKSQSLLKPPIDLHANDRLKRRGSSPLKHEYLPSEVSSASGLSSSAVSSIVEEGEETESDGESVSGTESESESSDEEMESLDIPQTELGYSIREDDRRRGSYAPSFAPSNTPASEVSLTPSNSASQAGLHGRKPSEEDGSIARSGRCLATVSRWSDKGTWKDVHPDHCSIMVTDGLIEAFAFRDSNYTQLDDRPIVALDLTPLVLIRQSTAVDLEIRSSMQPHSKLAPVYQGGNFRFRCLNGPDCYTLYTAVHHARLNNQKFIQLENEARFRSFGERPAPPEEGDKSSRRSWFGRKNSYRSSVRAPQSQHFDGASTTPSSTLSASSFLKKLTLVGNLSFNLARSSVDKRGGRGGSGNNSLYTTGSSSGWGSPRSPSVSVDNSGEVPVNFGTDNIRIRLHLLVSPAKWEDYGNCNLQIRRPPPGWRQALRADHGLEKRVTVTTAPKKSSEKPIVVLDAVLGSGCFTPMGSRGIVCGVWEEVKSGDGVVGGVPANGATGGNIKKWCFQFASVAEAGWVLRLVHQEVLTT